MPTITDPFFKKLYSKLVEEIDSRVSVLANGSALTSTSGVGIDAVSTAIKYQESVTYIAALQAVVELGIQIDNDHYGNRNKEDGD